MIVSEYVQQANDFLTKHNISFTAKYLYHGQHFNDNDETRSIWECVFTRPNDHKPRAALGFSIRFGQSLAKSYMTYAQSRDYKGPGAHKFDKDWPVKKPPTAYDVITCLTKYDPGLFTDWCGEFGYDNDSIKAQKAYFAVQEEWSKVRGFFSPEEIEEMQEIQ